MKQIAQGQRLYDIHNSNRHFKTETVPNLQAIDSPHLVQSFDDNASPIRKTYVFELTTNNQSPISNL